MHFSKESNKAKATFYLSRSNNENTRLIKLKVTKKKHSFPDLFKNRTDSESYEIEDKQMISQFSNAIAKQDPKAFCDLLAFYDQKAPKLHQLRVGLSFLDIIPHETSPLAQAADYLYKMTNNSPKLENGSSPKKLF